MRPFAFVWEEKKKMAASTATKTDVKVLPKGRVLCSFNAVVSFKNIRNRLLESCFAACLLGPCSLFFELFFWAVHLFIPRSTHSHKTRIMSFGCVFDLMQLEAVCKLTNNSREIEDIVMTFRRGLVGTKSADEVADIRAALTHLCYMTQHLQHQADVSTFVLLLRCFTFASGNIFKRTHTCTKQRHLQMYPYTYI